MRPPFKIWTVVQPDMVGSVFRWSFYSNGGYHMNNRLIVHYLDHHLNDRPFNFWTGLEQNWNSPLFRSPLYTHNKCYKDGQQSLVADPI